MRWSQPRSSAQMLKEAKTAIEQATVCHLGREAANSFRNRSSS
jgi:hypothetical protein